MKSIEKINVFARRVPPVAWYILFSYIFVACSLTQITRHNPDDYGAKILLGSSFILSPMFAPIYFIILLSKFVADYAPFIN